MTTDVSTRPLNDNMIDRGKAFNSSIHQPSYSTSLCPRFQVIDKFMSGQNRLGNINSEFQSRVKSHLQSCAPEDPTDKTAPLKTEDIPGTSRKRKTPSPTRPDEVNFILFGLFSPASPFHIIRSQRAALSEYLCVLPSELTFVRSFPLALMPIREINKRAAKVVISSKKKKTI